MSDWERADAREMAGDDIAELRKERDELRASLKKAVAQLEKCGEPATLLVGYRDLLRRTGEICGKRRAGGALCRLSEDHEGNHQGWTSPNWGNPEFVEWPR